MSVPSGIVSGMDDPDQKMTYAAEDMVTTWLDAVSPDTGVVQVTLSRGGRRRSVDFTPESEPRFTDPPDVTGFVDRVMERLRQQSRTYGSNYRGREKKPVEVRAFRGWMKATYRDGMILLPERERGGAWALRGFVVVHELAHHLNTGVDGAIIDTHGPGFRATMVQLLEDIGWAEIAAMLREAHRQLGLDGQSPSGDGMLAKVGKMLRHAEGAATEAERDAFFTKAQELATTHSIELAVARAAHAADEAPVTPGFEPVRLGHRGQQSNVRYIELMLAIARSNDLRCTIRGDNTGVTLYGFPGDIDVAKALYVSLVVQMVADADAYIRSGAHRPVHGRTARAAFYAGWTARIGQRLERATWAAQSTAGAYEQGIDEVTGEPGGALLPALVAKEVEVRDFFAYMRRQHGVRGTWRGSSTVADERSIEHGREAAERARLGHAKELSK
jgi:putative metallohydrolase (TIGR04338 family)